MAAQATTPKDPPEIWIPPQYRKLIEDLRGLKRDGNNPNSMTKREKRQLWKSIKDFGCIYPVVTNKDGVIANGEQTTDVCIKHGIFNWPVLRLPVKDVDRRLLRQVLNKLHGKHNIIADAQEFLRIIEEGHEADLKSLLDLSDSTLESYLIKIKEPEEETYKVPEIDKIQTSIKHGDIYRLGQHKLMCGDATNKKDVASLMAGKKAKMAFTDPPYGVSYDGTGRGGKNWGSIKGDESTEVFVNSLPLLIEATDHPQSFYICTSSRLAHEFIAALEKMEVYLATPIIWVKNRILISWERYHPQHEEILFCGDGAKPTGKNSVWYGGKNESTVWDLPLEPNWTYKHPTQKPVRLPKKAILNSSQPNEIILDIFGGSGSTLIACEQTERICYMMEIDPRFCQVIIDRWEAYTGHKAKQVLD